MESVAKSYWGTQKSNETGAYIRRYYLPSQIRFEFRDEDVEVLYSNVSHCSGFLETPDEISALLLKESCGIRYGCERIYKEIPSDQMQPAIDACLRYYQDKWDWSLSDDEVRSMIELNDRLRTLGHDINTECYRLNREIHARQEQKDPFLDDFEIEVEICFLLREDHPLSRDDDDNFIFKYHYSKTARPDYLEKWIRRERKQEKMNWNDARGAKNPEIRNNPLFNIPHCWLFHRLQSHSEAPLKHLCGIGTIWVDIQIRHQKFIEINQNGKPSDSVNRQEAA